MFSSIWCRYVIARKTREELFVCQRSLTLPLLHSRVVEKMQRSEYLDGDFSLGVTLDTERNANATLDWIRHFKVLGLSYGMNESFSVSSSDSNLADIVSQRAKRPELGHDYSRAFGKGRRGGKHETVEGFVYEAVEANVALKLYEAATANPIDTDCIVQYMSDEVPSAIEGYASTDPGDNNLLSRARRLPRKTEREELSQSPALARTRALDVVEFAIAAKVENDVYPTLVGDQGSHSGGWVIRSLRGELWLQMRNFMLADDNRYKGCGKSFNRTRANKVFCSDERGKRYRSKKTYWSNKPKDPNSREGRRRSRYKA